MRLAVIPARGGSKRIPRKNIKLFGGKPMIAWSIKAAIESQCFERIVVSTDDDEISEIATRHGAGVPFLRPPHLSDDYVAIDRVIAHAVEWHIAHGQNTDEVCCIFATAPFIQASDLQRGLEALCKNRADYSFSVTKYAFPIQRAVRITAENRVEMFDNLQFTKRSQDLEEAWHDAGQFYWGTSAAWLAHKPIFTSDSVPVVLPRFQVQDIDTLEDWETAETMLMARSLLNRNNREKKKG